MAEKWKSALMFSGGGTRIMIYLGIFAALEELDKRPDLLIATCGGSLASTIINAFPDSISRKDYLKSEEYFNFIKSLKLTDERKLKNIGLFSLKKILSKKKAPKIENVFENYLVKMDQDLGDLLPSLKNVRFSSQIPTVVIGSELLFEPSETGGKRNKRKLYRRIIFTDSETADSINLDNIKQTSENYRDSALTEDSRIKTNISMLLSSRISASDMFYIAPVFLENSYFAGGAIDLMPVEIAKDLVNEVVMEKKQHYNRVEESFVRAVLGYSGNKRLLEIQAENFKFQIDTTDIKEKLKGHFIAKKIDWKKFQIYLTLPKNIEEFRVDMDIQWKYGYEKTMTCFKNLKLD